LQATYLNLVSIKPRGPELLVVRNRQIKLNLMLSFIQRWEIRFYLTEHRALMLLVLDLYSGIHVNLKQRAVHASYIVDIHKLRRPAKHKVWWID